MEDIYFEEKNLSNSPIIVLTVGGFDPLHIGHISHFKEAKKLGDILIVGVQSDMWLTRKKGNFLMTLSDRMEIIRNLEPVDHVLGWDDGRTDCARIIEAIRPSIFAKGGDRGQGNIPSEEVDICNKLGVKVIYDIGGKKLRSSSELLNNYHNGE